MIKYKILALYGKGGSGKDTIQKWIVSNYQGCHGIVSSTTRPPRDYEKEGIDYFFLNKENFNKDLMLEYTKFNDWYYGTSIQSLNSNKINVGVFNLAGIKSLQKNPCIDVLPIEIQAEGKIRLERMLQREEQPNCKEICRRYLADEEDFEDFQSKIIYSNNKNEKYKTFSNLFSIPEVKKWLVS